MCGSAAFGQGSFQLGEVVAHEVKSDQHGGQHLFLAARGPSPSVALFNYGALPGDAPLTVCKMPEG